MSAAPGERSDDRRVLARGKLVAHRVVDAVAVAGVAHHGDARARASGEIGARRREPLGGTRGAARIARARIDERAVEKDMRMRLDETGHEKTARDIGGGGGGGARRDAVELHDHAAVDRDEKGAPIEQRLAIETSVRQDAPDGHCWSPINCARKAAQSTAPIQHAPR